MTAGPDQGPGRLRPVWRGRLRPCPARIVAARQIEFFSPIVEPVKAESSVEPRRILMISLVTAGAAVLFAASMFARKMMN